VVEQRPTGGVHLSDWNMNQKGVALCLAGDLNQGSPLGRLKEQSNSTRDQILLVMVREPSCSRIVGS
jgi:hypothetical protein